MTVFHIKLVLTCGVCVAMLSSLPAGAAEGRINFAGAVVSPTCAVVVEQLITRPPTDVSYRAYCPRAGTSAVASMHVLTVTQLSPRNPDPLLNYFASYVQAGGPDGGSAQLVTLIYD